MKQYFANLNRREQQTLTLAFPVVIALALWLFVARPLFNQQQQLSQTGVAKQQTLEWMLQSAAAVKASPTQSTTIANSSQLRQLATNSLKRQGLVVQRIQSRGDTQVSLWLEQVDFNRLLDALASMGQAGASIHQLQLTRQTPGKVNARLTLAIGGGS